MPSAPLATAFQDLAARAVARPLFWVVAVALFAAFPIVRAVQLRIPAPPPMLGALPAFSLPSASGQAVAFSPGAQSSFNELSGRVLVLDFLAPKEALASPFLARVAKLQVRLHNMGEALALVSFCRDASPAELQAIGQSRQASPRLWKLLAGQPEEIRTAVQAALRADQHGEPGATDLESLWRGNTLVLVDPQGQIRGLYDGSDPTSYETLVREVGLLANHVH